MNYRKEYIWKNGNFGDKLMDIGSYFPLLGLFFDNKLDNKIENKLKVKYSKDDAFSKIQEFKDKSLLKEDYHLISSILFSILLMQKCFFSEPKIPKEKLGGPNSLENVIKVLGKNENSHRIFDFMNYFA